MKRTVTLNRITDKTIIIMIIITIKQKYTYNKVLVDFNAEVLHISLTNLIACKNVETPDKKAKIKPQDHLSIDAPWLR